MMKKYILVFISLFLMGFNTFNEKNKHHFLIETIVFMRHGEKPVLDLGQLNCQGLNRALALPNVLLSKFGKPDYIFAPDPRVGMKGLYYYVRALASIEPTAIQLGLPVNTEFAFMEVNKAVQAFISPLYHSSLLFVAWEHFNITSIARTILKLIGDDPNRIPVIWPENDFDSLYVLKINWGTKPPQVTFKKDYEGLDNQSKQCPTG